MKQMRQLSISDIREMLTANQTEGNKLYVSSNIGMAIGINKVFYMLTSINEPFVVDEPRFVLVTRGSLRVTINLIDYDIHAGNIGYIGSGSIVQIHGSEMPDYYDGIGIMLNDETLRIALHGNMPQSLNGTETSFFVEANDEQQHLVRAIADALWAALHQEHKHTVMVNSLLAAFIYAFDDIHAKSASEVHNNSSRERDIFDRFISLVNKHSAQEHQLSFYADKLCITDKYLSMVVRNSSGTTAKAWIDRSLITAAKVMLYHTDMQITAIADRLNFPNTSFFCKFFKRNTGISPMQYREL